VPSVKVIEDSVVPAVLPSVYVDHHNLSSVHLNESLVPLVNASEVVVPVVHNQTVSVSNSLPEVPVVRVSESVVPQVKVKEEVKEEVKVPSVEQNENLISSQNSKVASNNVVPSGEADPSLNINDPSVTLSDPIDDATKLLIDLDVHVQKYVPLENADEVAITTTEVPALPSVYSNLDGDIELALPRQGSTSDVNTGALLDQLDNLQNRIQDTINRLMSNRRYVLSAMLRPMLNSVRRIRANIVRIQSQLNNIQSAATASSANRPLPGQSGTSGQVDQGALESIRRQIEVIQKRITDIISRISSSLSLTPPAAGAAQSGGQSGSTGR